MQDAKTLFQLGLEHLFKEDFEAALGYFKEILKINPRQTEVLVNLGVVYLKKNEPQVAIDYFSKALALNNNHLEARNNLAATFIHYDRYENALTHYKYLLEKDPNNLEYLFNSAVAKMALNEVSEAKRLYLAILKDHPKHLPSLTNLAAIYMHTKDKSKALECLDKLLSINADPSASFMRDALTGSKINEEADLTYLQRLFDNFAFSYEKTMRGPLHYVLPEHMLKILHAAHLIDFKKTLDLGCGTGLCGPHLKEISQTLTGVDISAKMVEQARNKALYNELKVEDFYTYFAKSKTKFNLIFACDVLPYFGKLDDLFRHIKEHLEPEGFFIFSCEMGEKEDWNLAPTGRFVHSDTYLDSLCRDLNWKIISKQTVIARKQEEIDVLEFVYLVENINSNAP